MAKTSTSTTINVKKKRLTAAIKKYRASTLAAMLDAASGKIGKSEKIFIASTVTI